MVYRIISAIVLTYWAVMIMNHDDSLGIRILLLVIFASIYGLGWFSGVEYLKNKVRGKS